MERTVIEGRKSRSWLCESVLCYYGFSGAPRQDQGDPLGGVMQRGRGGRTKRLTMSAAGARMLGGRRSWRREYSFMKLQSGGS